MGGGSTGGNPGGAPGGIDMGGEAPVKSRPGATWAHTREIPARRQWGVPTAGRTG